MTQLTKKPKILYIPIEEPIHNEESWKTLNDKFDLVYYDCATLEDWIEEIQKPDGKFAGIQGACRSTWLKGEPYRTHLIFKGEVAKYLPKSLKIVVQSGHGYDTADVPYLTSRNILFCNSPDCCSIATSDIGTSLVMQTFRYFTYTTQLMRNNGYLETTKLNPISENPRDKTLGIIGLGNIGYLTAKTCNAFGMNIVYHGRNQKPKYEAQIEGLKYYEDLNEMLAVTDCLFIACPLSESTRHLINFERFKHMKDKVRLVNVGRGPIVENEAVIDALERGQLVGLGLDVYEFEPKVDERLLNNYKVTLLPHMGVSSQDSFKAFEAKCVDNLMKYFYKKECPDAVNKEIY